MAVQLNRYSTFAAFLATPQCQPDEPLKGLDWSRSTKQYLDTQDCLIDARLLHMETGSAFARVILKAVYV